MCHFDKGALNAFRHRWRLDAIEGTRRNNIGKLRFVKSKVRYPPLHIIDGFEIITYIMICAVKSRYVVVSQECAL